LPHQRWRAVAPILLCAAGAAARPTTLLPEIDRPVTLRAGELDATMEGTYTNRATGFEGSVLSGGTAALGADYGLSDRIQLGLALAFPVIPGASLGSVVLSGAAAIDPRVAFRLDTGFEWLGTPSSNGDSDWVDRTTRWFGGFGTVAKIPVLPFVAFLLGRTGAIHLGHFATVGADANQFGANARHLWRYTGATGFSEGSSDLVVVSGGGENDNPTHLGLNVPLRLLVQPDPHFALMLQAGYSFQALFYPEPSPSLVAPEPAPPTRWTYQFVPIGIEAVVTPAGDIDLGARLFVDGLVAQSGPLGQKPDYWAQRAVLFWIRLRP
jgi:hypothetical protein